jgi:hypothetical protein
MGELALRGVLGAMAMSALRRVTTGLGLVEKPPPERVRDDAPLPVLSNLPPARREVATELLHWAFGAGAGVVYGVVPGRVRRHAVTGPLYGLAIWLAFEAAAPLMLGIEDNGRRPLSERAAIAADHVLYGVVLAARR